MPVHRPPDSRLLANLIAQEKEHAKQLAALFPVVNAALASLSAYATASGPSAHSIALIVQAFTTADDALHHRYAHAIDAWRAQLVALKDFEDDLAAVLRDRDILVTRLLKASKSTRDGHRSSRLITPPSTLGVSASVASLPSSNSVVAGNTNNKLAQAQAELQACEAHLLAKERELDARRIAVAHDGLGARCRALIDCAAVWTEMGKQGLKALQALGQSQNDASLGADSISKPLPTTYLGTQTASPSDSSSLTPSQSASQIVARSTEASHESPPSSNQHPAGKVKSDPKPQPKPEVQPTQKSRPNSDADAEMTLTIVLPPAHAIPELTVPTGVRSRSPSSDDHSATVTQQPVVSKMVSTSLPRRRSTNRSRRPLSQRIADEISDGSSSASHHLNSNINPTVDTTKPKPAPQASPNTSSEESEESNDEYADPSDGHPDGGPFQVVENDPFDVIRRSMVISPGPSVILTPVAPNTATDDIVPPIPLNIPMTRTALTVPTAARASASAPDVRTSVENPIAGSVGPGSVCWPVSGPTLTPAQPQLAKRERRTSFFGSLRGLFRKPKKGQERGRGAVTEWEDSDGRGTPEPSGRVSTGARVGGNWRRGAKGAKGGWVTRTDARIRGGANEDSDVEPISASAANAKIMSTVMDVGRRGSRLRKGRPDALARLPSTRRGHGNGNGIETRSGNGSTLSIPVHMSRSVRADGWVADGVGSNVMNIAPEGLGKPRTTRRSMSGRHKTSVAHLRGSNHGQSDGEVGKQNEPGAHPRPRRAATTGTSRMDATTTRHRRSASFSEVDIHILSSSATQASSQPPTRTPSSASSSSPKPQTRRQAQVNNGHVHKQHVKNQSLMSIVADVTHSRQDWDRGGAASSFDIPRVPMSSVLSREVVVDQDRSVVREFSFRGVGGERRLGMDTAIATTTTNGRGRGHSRSASSPESGDAERGQGGGRGHREGAVKMPLRSALRNASRTPSPSPVVVVTTAVRTTTMTTGTVVPRGGEVNDRNRVRRSWRDSTSVSSYATGRESLDGEVPPPLASPSSFRSRSPGPAQAEPSFTIPPPPPVEPPNGHANPNASETVPPSSTVSTETDANATPTATDTVKTRRKSVRMSLQPTFSPTPPAQFDEDDEDGEGKAPWSRAFSEGTEVRARRHGGGKKPESEGEDVWADSSEEDEAYVRARELLSQSLDVGRANGGNIDIKGKARARV